MLFATFPLILSSLLPSAAGQQLDKPLVDPPVPSLDQGLYDNRPEPDWVMRQWPPVTIPVRCKELAEDQGYAGSDMEAVSFSIPGEGCDNEWVFCFHKDRQEEQPNREHVMRTFGRLPRGMRNYQQHIVTFPDTGTHAFNDGNGNTALFGNVGDNMISLLVHEIGHTLTYHAYIPEQRPFHDTTIWQDAFNADSAISDDYARTNMNENLSQSLVIAWFDKTVPGGIHSVMGNADAISHEYTTVQNNIKPNILEDGATCDRVFPNSETVNV